MYRNLTIRQKQIVWAWAFLAVPVIFYVVIRFYPTANAMVISFQDWNLLGTREWAGWENYIKLWNDPDFWQVFRNTFVYLFLGTPISLVISFLIAYHLDKTRFMHGFIRMLYFLPFMTSAVAMAWVWRWFYQPVPTGLFNNFLAQFGIPQIEFLRSTTNALPSILAPAVWAGLGFQIIIFMAGLRAIPQSYYEAARIDGAGPWQAFYKVIFPLAAPALVITALFSFMTAWNEYVVAAVVLQDTELFTLPVGLKLFQGNLRAQWGLYAAGSLIVSIPVIALFLVLSRYLISGLTLGAVKG